MHVPMGSSKHISTAAGGGCSGRAPPSTQLPGTFPLEGTLARGGTRPGRLLARSWAGIDALCTGLEQPLVGAVSQPRCGGGHLLRFCRGRSGGKPIASCSRGSEPCDKRLFSVRRAGFPASSRAAPAAAVPSDLGPGKRSRGVLN